MAKKGYMSEKEVIESIKAIGITEYDGKEVNSDNFTREELIEILKKNNNTEKVAEKIVEKEVPKVEEKKEIKTVEITPKKDWLLHCPPHCVKKQLIKDVKTTVPEIVLCALKTEKVID